MIVIDIEKLKIVLNFGVYHKFILVVGKTDILLEEQSSSRLGLGLINKINKLGLADCLC